MMTSRMLAVLGFTALFADLALATDNKSGPTSEDLEQVCKAQKGVCVSVCPADDGTFSGFLLNDMCKEDCNKKYGDCLASIPQKKRKQGVTKHRTGNSDEVLGQ